MTPLSNRDLRELRLVVLGAFTLPEFDRLMFDRLGKRRTTEALGDDANEIVARVLDKANRYGWLADLVKAMREENPANPELYAFAEEQFGLGVLATPRKDRLQRVINETNSFLDVAKWRSALGVIEPRVCRITAHEGSTALGTGFLVGPSAVLTNFHVIEPVLNGNLAAAGLRAQFDYKVMPGAAAPDQGRLIALAVGDGWLIDKSPYAESDLTTGSATLPTAEELDYAILRLNSAIGSEPIGNTTALDPALRGWIDITQSAKTPPEQDSPVFIVQHPKGEPLKLALDTKSVIGFNQNKTRLRYRTNTEPGSSGSPVFNQNWELIALHHVGDPAYSELHKPEYNQGVPIGLIAKLLEARGKLAKLSE
jgi:hypothetical protein